MARAAALSRHPLPDRIAARSRHARVARAPVGARPQGVLQHRGAMEGARRGCPRTAGRRHQRAVLRDEAEARSHARHRSPHAHFLSDRHFQGAAHPPLAEAGRRVGAPAEQQSDFCRRDAARLHDSRRLSLPCRPCAACSTRVARDEAVPRLRSSGRSTRIGSSRRGICRRATACSSRSATTMHTCRPSSSSTRLQTIACWPAQQLLPGIGIEELVFAVPHAAVINAAFCHPHPARQPVQRTDARRLVRAGSRSRRRRRKSDFTSPCSWPRLGASTTPSPTTTTSPISARASTTFVLRRPARARGSIPTPTSSRRRSRKSC